MGGPVDRPRCANPPDAHRGLSLFLNPVDGSLVADGLRHLAACARFPFCCCLFTLWPDSGRLRDLTPI